MFRTERRDFPLRRLSTAHYIQYLCSIFLENNTVIFNLHVIFSWISCFFSNLPYNLLYTYIAGSENIKCNTLDGHKLLIYGIDVTIISA